MKPTRNGIYYDLKATPFFFRDNDYVFFFSSEQHLMKFLSKQLDNRQKISESLSNRFNFTVHLTALADIVLYKKIETRGYCVMKDGEEVCEISL